MKLIFKYLKPFIFTILLIVGFTFGQVQTELALPDYMSDIVTNGIQYGGITETMPKVLTAKDMNTILLFSEDDDLILKQYDLVKEGSTSTIDKQQIKFTEDVYLFTGEDVGNEMLLPLVYSYIASSQGLEIDENNVSLILPAIQQATAGLEDNYVSMVRLNIQNLYANVGLATAKIQTNYILRAGLLMLGIALISMLAQIVSTYLATKTASKIANRIRHDVFEKVQSFSQSEFSKFSTSSLITRTNNDIDKIQQLTQMMMRMMLMAPMMGLTSVFKVVRYPSISWILLVAIGFILSIMIVLATTALPKFEKIQKLTDSLNNVLREFLDGMLVVRAFNAQDRESKKFDEVNAESTKTHKFVMRMMNIMGPVMTLVMNTLTVLIVWFSAKLIDIDVMTIGDMMAFTQYAMHVVMSFMMVSVMFVMVPRSIVSANRVKEVLDTQLTIKDKEVVAQMPKENGILEFKNVSFKYPGAEEKVLDNISFSAKPSETVAIIGSTGSGKSTVIKLIPRLFDVTEGSIEYCGKDIREYKQSELHDRIGFATQKALLFTGDIESNIKFGRDISDEEMQKAIAISQSTNIINEKEEGIKSLITQGGTNVSGGQKQRLSIARTLAKDKNIYIFDDTFSALDYATDKKLRAELNELIKQTKATVIIVAQRISTIKNADKILVLENGKIVGEGTHEYLLSNCDVYKEIAYSQLSKEELA